MRASATVSFSEGICKIKIDIFEAVWGYMLFDNIALMGDSNTRTIHLFSMNTGKALAETEFSKDDFEQLTQTRTVILNYSQGDEKTEIIKFEPIDFTGCFIEAIKAQSEGKNDTAAQCYEEVLSANAGNYRAYSLLGRCFRNVGKPDEALRCYNKAIELAPWSPEAYCNMGVLYQKQGKETEAQSCFKNAIEVSSFYFSAVSKRAAWLLENDIDSYEMKSLNLRLNTVFSDITAAQTHIKSYMEKLGYDRIAYEDKQTAMFDVLANAKLQKKLKLIEDYIFNGAFFCASECIKGVLQETKGTSAEKMVSCWCHTHIQYIVNRLKDTTFTKLLSESRNLLESTISEKELKSIEEAAAIREAYEKAHKLGKDALEAEQKAAIAAIENKVTSDGDFSQPIAGPVEKEITEEEKAEAIAEHEFISQSVTLEPATEQTTEQTTEQATESPSTSALAKTPEQPVEPAPVLAPEKVQEVLPEADAENSTPASDVSAEKPQLSKDYKSPVKGVKPVTIEEFFMLVLFEIMRDGEIEEAEKNFLASLKEKLNISDGDFQKMFTNVRSQVKARGYEQGEQKKFNPQRLFKNLCKAAMRDGVLEDSEKKILLYAGKIFKINEKEIKKMLLEVRP